MENQLQGANFKVPVNAGLLEFEQRVYNTEFLERMKLIIGETAGLPLPGYGIVDELDPSTVAPGDARPLVISTNASDPLQMDVTPGIAVTRSGHRLLLTETVEGVVIPGDVRVQGGKFVVLLRLILDSLDPEVSLGGTTVPSKRVKPSDPGQYVDPPGRPRHTQAEQVQVLTWDEWSSLTDDQQADMVVLALVTLQAVANFTTGGNQIELLIDQSNDDATWVRPWFSPVDLAHRSKHGTGTITDQNPHGIGANDLTVGNFPLFALLRDHGLVISKDIASAGSPGFACTEDIAASAWINTQIVVLGVPADRWSVLVTGYPISGLRLEDATGVTYPVQVIPNTNRIYIESPLPPIRPPDTTLTYLRASALEPPPWSPTGTFSEFLVGEVASSEIVISNGAALSALTVNRIALADNGPMARQFSILVDEVGELFKIPQIVHCYRVLSDDDVDVTHTFERTLLWSTGMQIEIGLVIPGKTEAPGTMSFKVTVRGTDIDGQDAEEEIEFKGGDPALDPDAWEGAPVPNGTEVPQQFRRGTTVWQNVADWKITANQDVGALSGMTLYAIPAARAAADLNNFATSASTLWDGRRALWILDARQIELEV